MDYKITIGLEVHTQLKTSSKLFCGCSTNFGASPNSQTCPVCLGLPGVLPVVNRKAVALAVKAALALNCKINSPTKFDRKNYFYPDLPKNYQISQYDLPLAKEGYLEIPNPKSRSPNGTETPSYDGAQSPRRIGITRAHLEEDAGKSMHSDAGYSLVDLNRTGVPLLEIVSEPDINSPDQAHQYLTALKELLIYLEISDCDMEKGSLRVDANISISPVSDVSLREVPRRASGDDEVISKSNEIASSRQGGIRNDSGETKLGVKTEIKNLNSFKFVAKALEFEANRQIELLKSGKEVVQETRLWDEDKQETRPLRSKEDVQDYRYFPEPDLEPLVINEGWIGQIRKTIPELPAARRVRFVNQYGIPEYDADVLTADKELANYFEECVKSYNSTQRERSPASGGKAISNWLMSEVAKYLNEQKMEMKDFKIKPQELVELVKFSAARQITSTAAKEVFGEMLKSGKSATAIVSEKGLLQVSDQGEIEVFVKEALKSNPQMAADYKAGKTVVLQALVGQVMRLSKGKSNPEIVRTLLQKHLSEK
ncbi:MAG: Asp-tRNA(Asn)/Glu-tRNA(Gln) amidotransferase subunit GatB [Planctomycetes bacterium]|nr:Asp-tRNA(Asn)/Glu-tRNA(Gln) amidotransferase subunit GatB [Planctomycetota bacterium]